MKGKIVNLLKKCKCKALTLPKKNFYHKLKRLVEADPNITKLFPKEMILAHYGEKKMRDNIFHPDLFITQIRYFRLYEYFKKYYPEVFNNSMKVLNVGDSSGILFNAMNRTGDSVNINPESVSRIKDKGIAAYCASIYELPFLNKSYDYVFSFQCLEHLESPLQALKELTRVAKKRIFVSIPYQSKTRIYSKNYWIDRVRKSPEKGGWGVSLIDKECDYHIFELSTKDFVNLVSYTDFSCSRHFPINYFKPLGDDAEYRGSYFNFFELEPLIKSKS